MSTELSSELSSAYKVRSVEWSIVLLFPILSRSVDE